MTLVRPAVFTAFIIFIFGSAYTAPPLHAQALVTASKAAEITAFGGYNIYNNPDYGANTNKGFLAGADFTIFRNWWVDPSVEARFVYTAGTGISEHAILVGPRAQKDYGRFHPYVDVLVGEGFIDYNPPPSISPKDHGDSGLSLAYGAGIDVDLVRNFSLKADFLQQNWNLGQNSLFQPDGSNYTLTPRTVSVGVTYHFPFSGLRKQRELQ
jgi:opacity protein-like surface antigen